MLLNAWTILGMEWFGFFYIYLSAFMQVFSDVKLLGIIIGPKNFSKSVFPIRRKLEYWAMNGTGG